MAVVHTPGVEPLELPVVVVLMELVVVLLLGPINISGLRGKSAILYKNKTTVTNVIYQLLTCQHTWRQR